MFLSAFLYLCGCGGSDDDPGDTTDTIEENEIPATLTNIQQEVFTPSCSQSACHGASAGGDLDLTSAATSYSELVNVGAFQTNAAARGKILVIPGDPDNSFLIQKLDGTLESDEGEVMPRATSGLSRAKIDLVRQWISDGALND